MGTTRFPMFFAKVGQFARPSRYCLTTVVLLSASLLCALAQDGHAHMLTPPQQLTSQQKANASVLVKIVRESTERLPGSAMIRV
jgi:hypothetical protein